ncbi:divalent-cation tolerance protein CutA [Methanotorris formicicus]|uniref:CutA1 divalent ion tolerance protein n=1 Tax=Methanotorris formicicus Mc-S-70 TaxID=647171 RepID=H1KXB8_9EURY|nr:divalent-cation tolerance protein CutA [Methanotorris formicicus]EHP88330.1 CutA1 divalent ion tolerance protein [Methanotorris formicicus Mc-S-70]
MYALVYITASNREEAKNIVSHLLENRLVACANIFPIESMYWWKGRIENDGEVAIILKTKEKLVKKIIEEVKKLHSYTNPCIIAIPIINGSEEFLKWIDEETSNC